MTETMRLRGPDDGGTYVRRSVALGHRRLSILDLENGSQPMIGRRHGEDVVLVYTGEVYNFTELRTELRSLGHTFRTNSDTEIVLNSYLQWGASCVERFNGMFAFAVWDGYARQLMLFRDRVGIKPLYFHHYNEGLVFGSEPKAILASGLLRPALDHSKIAVLMQPRLALPGETPMKGLREVRPGHVVYIDQSGMREQPYWALRSEAHRRTYEETTRDVRELLEDIVARQMVADVPRAAMLSGGLDSTAVAALAARNSAVDGERLRTFCVEFDSDATHFSPTELRPEVDGPYARAAAEYIGSQHNSIALRSAEIADYLPQSRAARDLPGWGSFDASMYILFGKIREHCTVALSGEAADEIFGGYPWFFKPELVERQNFPWLGDAPRVASCLSDDVLSGFDPLQDELDRYQTLKARVPTYDGDDAMNARMREVLYFSMAGPLGVLLDRKDRMSMAHGLEVRVPYCDHRLIEYMWNVPWSFKSQGGMKGLLKDAVADLVPVSTATRKKSGYPGMHDPDYDEQLLKQVDWIVNDPASPLYGMFDGKRVDALIEGCGKSVTWINAAHMLIPLVETAQWIESYNVSV